MSEPWEDYAPSQESGPWSDYSAPPQQQTAPRYDAIEQPSGFEDWLARNFRGGGNLRGSAVGRVMQGMADPGAAAFQLGANLIGQGDAVNQRIAEKEAEYQAARQAAGSTGFDPVRMAGNIAITAPIGGAAAVPASLGGRVALGAAQGAGYGALQPVTEGDYWDEKGSQVKTGALVGGIAAPVIGAASRLISPKASVNPDVAALRQAGVQPTIGQALGGTAARVEEKMQSLPIMGEAITAAHGRGIEQLNKAVLNRAVEGIGGKVTKTGAEGLKQARQQLSQAYDDLLPKMSVNTLDDQFVSKVSSLRGMVQSLPQKEAQQFDSIIAREIDGRLAPNGMLSGNNLKQAQAAIRDKASQFARSNDAYQSQLGQALKQLDEELRQLVTSSNPSFAKQLEAINKGYAVFKRAQQAGAMTGGEAGKFTPAQLQRAVRSQDVSKDKRAFSEGTAYLQDLSDAAVNVMKNKTPDSGTATRIMYGGGALASGMINPLLPGSLIAGAGAYTPALQRLLVGAVANRPQQAQSLAELLRQSQPYITAGAVPAFER